MRESYESEMLRSERWNPRQVAAASAILLSLVLSAPDAQAERPPSRLYLAPVADSVLHGVKAVELTRLLERQLRKRRLSLVATEEEADVVARVQECTRYESHTMKTKVAGAPVTLPTGRGAGFGSEQEWGARTETEAWTILVVRLTRGELFEDVAGDPGDKTVPEAAESVSRGIERLLSAGSRLSQRATAPR